MSSTRLELEEECLRILSQRDEAVHAVPIPLTTTALSSDTTSINATPLGRGTGHANRFDGCHVKVAETVASGPAIGEIAAVDDGGFDLTDELTVSPAFTAAVRSGTDLLLYPKGLTPEYLVERINSVLRHTEYPYIWMPSLVPDSDFAANDVTNWPVVAGGSRSFATTPTASLIFGERTLLVSATSLGDGVDSSSFDSYADEVFIVQLIVRMNAGSVTVSLRNATADTHTVSLSLTEHGVPTIVQFTDTTDSRLGKIRMVDAAAAGGSQWYLSPTVVVQSQSRRQYLAPSWLSRKEQIREAVKVIPNFSVDTDLYSGYSQTEEVVPYDVLRSEISLNKLFVEFEASDSPVGFVVMRPFAEMATDTATSVVDKDYVAAKTVANILRDRKDNEWIRWAAKASSLAYIRGYGQNELVIDEKLAW